MIKREVTIAIPREHLQAQSCRRKISTPHHGHKTQGVVLAYTSSHKDDHGKISFSSLQSPPVTFIHSIKRWLAIATPWDHPRSALGASGYRRACPLTTTTSDPRQSSTRSCRPTSGSNLQNPQCALVDVSSSSLGFVLNAASRADERATFDEPGRIRKETITSTRGDIRASRE